MGSFTVVTDDAAKFLLCTPCRQVYLFNEMRLENMFSESSVKSFCCLCPAYIFRAFSVTLAPNLFTFF